MVHPRPCSPGTSMGQNNLNHQGDIGSTGRIRFVRLPLCSTSFFPHRQAVDQNLSTKNFCEYRKSQQGESIMAKGSNPLKKIIGLAFLVVGIGLAIWAYQMSGSIGSQIKEVFSGAPTDKVMMMYIGSAVCAVIGFFLLIKK